MSTHCHLDRKSGQHLLRSHLRTCGTNTCEGCEPCRTDDDGNPVRHCGNCRGKHSEHLAWGEFVCPRCVGRIRADMREIEDRSTELLVEAIFSGVDSEAANLAGPVPDAVRWVWRKINERRAGVAEILIEEADFTHPLTCLTNWERELREDLGHDDEVLCSATISEARKYLDLVLTMLARSEAHVLVLAEMARDMRRCRAHVETVLRDSREPEKGAPCPTCSEAASEDERAPRLVMHRADHDVTGAADVWRCPDVEAHWWSEADYRMRVGATYLQHADRLTASQMETQYDIKPSTLRTWAERGQVAKRGKDNQGRQTYDVSQAKAARDSERITA